MSSIVSRNVVDLPEASKQGIEQLLGAPLKPHERVYIVVDAPPAGPAEPVRIRAAKRIEEIIAHAQANADRQGVPDAEIEAAIEEAMRHVRPRP
jgi:hypothetical protein